MLSAPSPFSFILFGASGHLARMKLYPALYILTLKKRFPEHYNIIGFSRSDMDESAFRNLFADAVHEHVPEVNENVLTNLLQHVHYHRGQYTQSEDFAALASRLSALEKGWKNVVRLAYYSVPPTAFSDVSHNMCEGGVHTPKIPLRCIVEKPVGHDLKSFQEIKTKLLGCFKEEDIYLLDHYLGKEAVRNMYYLRFANPVLERLFKNTMIHHVEITSFESVGLEGRAGYFESTGTLRDVFQNHLLMIASLLTMRLAEGKESVTHNRESALKQFYLPPSSDFDDVVLQGQYEAGEVNGESVSGYRGEEGVAPDSRTNTFDVLKLLTRAPRWEGVPFYLRSGKRLEKKLTRVTIQFQEFGKVGEGAQPNKLCIILQGEAGMRLHLQTKLGGTNPAFRPLIMEDPLVCVGDCLPEHSLLLLEAVHGIKQWFLGFDEVQAAWRLIDPIQTYLDKKNTPLHMYKAGSKGPQEANEWIEKDGITWF